MTTREFSATDLPHPRYSLEVGRFTIRSTKRKEGQERQNRHHSHLDQRHQHDDDDDSQQQNKRQKLIRDGNASSTNGYKKNGGGVVSVGNREDGDDYDASNNGSGDVNLPSTCLPRFSQLAQVIEVRKPGFMLPSRALGANIKDFLGSYCIIENARPELFIRRDFLSKFVDKGTIHVAQLSDQLYDGGDANADSAGPNAPPQTSQAAAWPAQGATQSAATQSSYQLTTTKNNVLIITMDSKQYHRFGLVATKVVVPMQQRPRPSAGRPFRNNGATKGSKNKGTRQSTTGSNSASHQVLYRIEIDLKDERIMTSNKYQDKLMQTFRRLNSINKLYFRFIPDKSKLLGLSQAAAQELSLEYFNYVIEEYKLDGCKPIPLTRCSLGQQRILNNFVNRSQLHPPLGVSKLLMANNGEQVLFESQLDRGRDDEKFEGILKCLVDIVDWLGYQLLKLDCDKLAKFEDWNDSATSTTRVDVSCTQIIGTIDFKQVQDNLRTLFAHPNSEEDDVLQRALILYDAHNDKELMVYIADYQTDTRSGALDVMVCKCNTSIP